MGIMGSFFKFSGHCFDVLAWPLFALVYPLYASIQAIETNSISDTQKLISYWVCFSLILLFENAFSELLECLPWWTYIKVLIVGCLVTPHFEGSLYVYKHIVHPCLSIDLHVLLNELVNLMGKVLAEAKNAEDTAGEALQNLTALKPEFEESKVVQKDISPMEITKSQESALTKQLQFGELEPDFTPSGNRATAPLDFTGTTPTRFAAGGLPDVLPSNNIQKEWTCAVCQVTTTREADLISHLQGRRHESACEKLKAYNQTSKSKVSSASAKENANAAESRGNSPDTKQTHKPWTCATCHVTATNKADLVSHFQGSRHKDALEKLKAKFQTSEDKSHPALAAIAGRDVPNIPWTCAVCQLKITNLASLVSHLEGRRHEDACKSYQAKIKSMKSLRCTICNITCSGEGNMKSHLMGSKHLTNARAQQQT